MGGDNGSLLNLGTASGRLILHILNRHEIWYASGPPRLQLTSSFSTTTNEVYICSPAADSNSSTHVALSHPFHAELLAGSRPVCSSPISSSPVALFSGAVIHNSYATTGDAARLAGVLLFHMSMTDVRSKLQSVADDVAARRRQGINKAAVEIELVRR
jgi:hypothetical protein